MTTFVNLLMGRVGNVKHNQERKSRESSKVNPFHLDSCMTATVKAKGL